MSLPPLPDPADQMEGYYAPDEMHDFAKLAVREALERVIQALDCDAAARAIIKEYE